MKKFKELREHSLEEKLKASDPAGTYVSDFVHSDNPKFAGKSKAKRIQMALAASYAAKGKSRNEEVEQQDEAMSHQAATTMKHIPNPSPALKKAAKDIKPGIAGYRDRIDMLKAGGVKEEAEQVDELSKSTLGSYVKKASLNRSQLSYGSGLAASRGVTDTKGIEKDSQRAKGISKAVGRLSNEEVESVEEAANAAQQAAMPPKHYGGKGVEGAKFDLYMQKRKQQNAAMKPKSVEEGIMDAVKNLAAKAGKALTGGSDEDQRKDLQRKMGVPQTGKKPTQK